MIGGSTYGYTPTTVTEIFDPSSTHGRPGQHSISRELPMGAVVNGELYVMAATSAARSPAS
jgi:hypothetical protein